MSQATTPEAAAAKPTFNIYDKMVFAFIFMMVSIGAYANTIQNDDPFYDFFDTVDGWASGGLGVGIAITSVLIGGARAVGNNNPMSALGGVALAAFIHWGPGIIKDLIADGAVFM